MSRPWSKSVDVIIQFNQLLNEAFVWCNGPLTPEKKSVLFYKFVKYVMNKLPYRIEYSSTVS